MKVFSPEEINLIYIYDSGNRTGTIRELREMMNYLMPDEKELTTLAQDVIDKLDTMTDDEYKTFSDELIPDTFSDFSDEDSAYRSCSPLLFDCIDLGAEIE